MKRHYTYILFFFLTLPLFAQDLDLIYFRFDYSMYPQLVRDRIEKIKNEAVGETILLIGVADSLYLYDKAVWDEVDGAVAEAPSSAEFNAFQELHSISRVIDEYVALTITKDEEGYEMTSSEKGIKNLNISCIVGDRYIKSGYINELWSRFLVVNDLTKRYNDGVNVSFTLHPCGASYANEEFENKELLQFSKKYSIIVDSIIIEN